MLTRREITELADAISAFARSADESDLELIRSLGTSIGETYQTELGRRQEFQVLLETLAERDRNSARHDSQRHGHSLQDLAEKTLEAERTRSDRVDLPKKALYGRTALLPQDLTESEPRSDGGFEDLLERVTALENENAQLLAENQELRAEVARLKIGSPESSTDSGEIREVVAETRTGLEDLPEVDITKVELFPGRPVNPWDHLRLHYGTWLRMYNNERDMITLDMIRDHDQKLVEALQMKISRERAKAKREGGIIPPTLAELITTEEVARRARLEQLGIPESLFLDENRKIAMALYSRLHGYLFRPQ